MREQYFINKPYWRNTNRRTAALAEFLKGFERTLVEIQDERTPHLTKEDLLAFLELHVDRINKTASRGCKLTVRITDFSPINDGGLHYTFELEGSSEVVGSIHLERVRNTIGYPDDIAGKEAENG